MLRSEFFSNVYDILGYMIPGLVVLWSGRVLAREVLGLDLAPDVPSDALAVTILLLAAPATGFLFQSLGRRIERDLINTVAADAQGNRRRMFPSERYRLQDDSHFSVEFKERFETKAAETFGLPSGTREAFDLAYHYLLVNGQASLTERFNALYGMARGLSLALAVSGCVHTLFAVKDFGTRETESGWEAAFVAVILFGGSLLALTQARSFGRRFADSVFRGFLASTAARSTE